ncbi:SpoIIE family protein phosphatase [Nonomuraea gerenzanensis]|uniref:protein-serine/threonine phosphatase n=1 Tax=Nonomuraea gerenzanensis TaxID=93944 RepID=A0A1M4EE24_9ACTN|nr:SpoIIE family protein phosphatase [Nonomuraea gerenzanensis]UBU08478.1 SpoIIE family protein phosphatase [Nonomuraea gerenzanensis]SBO96823.1 Serine phosphatase RsbU, regulator of sigma subunit [Nonomuraea gerenzanensis]
MGDDIEAAGRTTPAVAVLDGTGTVTGWTQAAEELTGYLAADILGRPIATLLPPGGDERPFTHPPRTARVEVRRRDGGRVAVRAEAAPLILGGDGQRSWLVSAVPDTADPSADLLKSLVSSFPVAMAIWDEDLRCVWFNEAAGQLSDGYPYYRIGRSLTETVDGIDTRAVQDAMRGVLADGRPTIDREARWSHAGRERTLSISLLPLQGADGRTIGVCSVALDFSNSKARDHLTLLREEGVRLSSTLDVMDTAQALAEVAVPVLADYVTVDLPEAILPGTEPQRRPGAERTGGPVFRRAGAASVREGTPAPPWERGEPVSVPPRSPFMRVMQERRPHFEPVLDTSPGTWLELDPDRARIVHATGMHSLIVIALEARGDVLGVAAFARTSNPAPFTRDDLLLAEELVTRAALSLDNARQYTRQRLTALTLQRDLLPHDLRGSGTVEVASRYLPSDTNEGVGGDWYDTIGLPGDRLALVVGDVTGHGINAAATMGRLRTAVHTLAYLDLPPDELLTHLDRLIAKDARGLDATGATCLYAVHDPRTGRCTMATAGHPPPAIVTPYGEVTFPSLPAGTPIGVGLGTFESRDLHLPAGTLLALYTDGLIETRQADLDAGMARLGDTLARAAPRAATLEQVCEAVIGSIVGDTPAEDDIALLLARIRDVS